MQPLTRKQQQQTNKEKKKKKQTSQSKKWPKELNRHFFNEEIQKANKHMKICSPSLKYYRNANKSTVRYHLTPVRMPTVKNSTNNIYGRECGENIMLLHYWWECKLIQSLWRTIWRFLKKLKLKLTYDPTIPLLGIYLEKIIIKEGMCM